VRGHAPLGSIKAARRTGPQGAGPTCRAVLAAAVAIESLQLFLRISNIAGARHSVALNIGAIHHGHRFVVAFLVRLRAPEPQRDAPLGLEGEVVDGERDEFRSAERSAKTEQHQRSIARAEQVIRGRGDERADLFDGQVCLLRLRDA
jgi:hypothetical protein